MEGKKRGNAFGFVFITGCAVFIAFILICALGGEGGGPTGIWIALMAANATAQLIILGLVFVGGCVIAIAILRLTSQGTPMNTSTTTRHGSHRSGDISRGNYAGIQRGESSEEGGIWVGNSYQRGGGVTRYSETTNKSTVSGWPFGVVIVLGLILGGIIVTAINQVAETSPGGLTRQGIEAAKEVAIHTEDVAQTSYLATLVTPLCAGIIIFAGFGLLAFMVFVAPHLGSGGGGRRY